MAYKRGHRIAAFRASFLPALITFHFVLLLVRIVDWLVFDLRIEGREWLHQVPSGVLVSNHTLVLDPGIIAHVIRPRRTYFTMLEQTACIPLLGTFVRLLGAIPIPATPASIRILERALRRDLHDLPFLHVFPEGECYLWNQQIREFHPGAFYLACRLGLPVVPVTTVLHRRRWPGREFFRFAGRVVKVPPRVTVVIGPALRADGGHSASLKAQAQELGRRTRTVMQRTIDLRKGCKEISKGRMPRLALQQNQGL